MPEKRILEEQKRMHQPGTTGTETAAFEASDPPSLPTPNDPARESLYSEKKDSPGLDIHNRSLGQIKT